MANSGLAITRALNLITSAKPLDHDILAKTADETSADTVKLRKARALGLAITMGGAIAALGLLTSPTTALHASSKASNNKKAINSIKMDLEGLKQEQFRFINETKHMLDSMQDAQNLIMHETRIYAAHLNLKLGLQDSIITHVNLLQDIHYGKYSPLIVTPAELEDLQKTITEKTAKKLSPKVKDYIIRPVLVDNKLAVDIVIPLLDPAREATIFKLIKVPTFQDGTKLYLDCDHDFVALYENSNTYNPLTNDEVAACLAPHEHCYAATPILANAVDHCVARQFNQPHPDNTYKKAPDQTPFFHTIGNVTIYSVPTTTLVDFHCPEINKPGPDLSFNITKKGFFVNPYGNCRFTTKYAKFEPPTEKYALTSYIQELFSLALDPKNYNFPRLPKFSIREFPGSETAAQTATAQTVSLAIPIITVILFIFGAAIVFYGCGLSYLQRAKNRLKDKFGGIMDYLDPEAASDRRHKDDYQTAVNMGLIAPPVPQAGRPILKNRGLGPIRPKQREYKPYGPAPRPKNYQDPFEINNIYPLYPNLPRTNSDPALFKFSNGVTRPRGELPFSRQQEQPTFQTFHHYEPVPSNDEAVLLANATRYAVLRKDLNNETSQDAPEPMDTSL